MSPTPIKLRILRYLQKHQGAWIAKGSICDLARQHTGATGEHCGRRLRELENEGKIEVEYRKGHAYYRAATQKSFDELNRQMLREFETS